MMKKLGLLLAISALAFLVGPVMADEMDDLYRSYKNGAEDPPQWLVDQIFGANEPDGSRCAGGDDFEDAFEIPFLPCNVFYDSGNSNNFGRDFDTSEDASECQVDGDNSPNCFAGKDVFYRFTLPSPFQVTASVCGNTSFDSVLGILDADHQLVAMNDDHDGCSSHSSLIEACCLPAGDYFLIVDGYGHNAKGNFSLELTFGCSPCSGDDDEDDDEAECDELVIQDISLPFHGIVSNDDAPDVCGSGAGDVAVRFTLDGNSSVDLQTCFSGTTIDADSYWYRDAAPCAGGVLMCYNDGEQGCNWATHVAYDCDSLLAAGTYVVVLSGWEAQEGGIELDLDTSTCAVVEADDQPVSLALAQNSPNPFNPVTTIAFEMPETDVARLSVHDVTGREVAVLVDGLTSAGPHQVAFDGGRLSSGVYLYTLRTSRMVETRKMILTK